MKIFVLIMLCLFLVKNLSFLVRELRDEDGAGVFVGFVLFSATVLAIVFQSISISSKKH